MSKVLATIKLDCELNVKLDEMDYNDPFNKESYELFKSWSLRAFLEGLIYRKNPVSLNRISLYLKMQMNAAGLWRSLVNTMK